MVFDRVAPQLPPIVVFEPIRVQVRDGVGVASPNCSPPDVDTLAGPVPDQESAGRRQHPLLGVGERCVLVIEIEQAGRLDPPVADLVDDDVSPR